ncbi:hypothetical protein ABGB07_38405 [Micromonosporaceae bacterium B7E4]
MTGVELILAALAAGATAGLSGATSSAIGDSYNALKNSLVRRLVNRAGASRAIELHEVDPDIWRDHLSNDLIASGAANDGEILASAQQLLDALQADTASRSRYRIDLSNAKGVQVGDHNTQTNTFS